MSYDDIVGASRLHQSTSTCLKKARNPDITPLSQWGCQATSWRATESDKFPGDTCSCSKPCGYTPHNSCWLTARSEETQGSVLYMNSFLMNYNHEIMVVQSGTHVVSKSLRPCGRRIAWLHHGALRHQVVIAGNFWKWVVYIKHIYIYDIFLIVVLHHIRTPTCMKDTCTKIPRTCQKWKIFIGPNVWYHTLPMP
jgi:hypothetical protein